MKSLSASEPKLPPEVAERLGPFYVYALIDPRNNKIFYIGKGTGKRLLDHGHRAHLIAESRTESAKISRIREIRSIGCEPHIDIIHHGLSESEALLMEAGLIDSIADLTNVVSGHGAIKGRSSLNELIRRYGAQPIDSNACPAVLIRLGPWKKERMEIEKGIYRIGHGYREEMPLPEIVDSTRAWWKIDPRRIKRQGIRHAVGVHEGVTRCVMEIGDWTRRLDGRRAFEGIPLTHGQVFEEWVGPFGKRVEFMSGIQNPILYWPFK
jgi:hypothetical protein